MNCDHDGIQDKRHVMLVLQCKIFDIIMISISSPIKNF